MKEQEKTRKNRLVPVRVEHNVDTGQIYTVVDRRFVTDAEYARFVTDVEYFISVINK